MKSDINPLVFDSLAGSDHGFPEGKNCDGGGIPLQKASNPLLSSHVLNLKRFLRGGRRPLDFRRGSKSCSPSLLMCSDPSLRSSFSSAQKVRLYPLSGPHDQTLPGFIGCQQKVKVALVCEFLQLAEDFSKQATSGVFAMALPFCVSHAPLKKSI